MNPKKPVSTVNHHSSLWLDMFRQGLEITVSIQPNQNLMFYKEKLGDKVLNTKRYSISGDKEL